MTLYREGRGGVGWLVLYFVHRAHFLFEESPILEWFVGSWCGKVGTGTFQTIETLLSIFKIFPPSTLETQKTGVEPSRCQRASPFLLSPRP